MLTTTLHADTANRELRNEFRQTFRIDIVVCSPDQAPGQELTKPFSGAPQTLSPTTDS
jgi:hypothetical protein